jgi:hypothetical protein
MQPNQSRVYVMPLVKEKPPPLPATAPPTQRELVRASLLARPDAGSTAKPGRLGLDPPTNAPAGQLTGGGASPTGPPRSDSGWAACAAAGRARTAATAASDARRRRTWRSHVRGEKKM